MRYVEARSISLRNGEPWAVPECPTTLHILPDGHRTPKVGDAIIVGRLGNPQVKIVTTVLPTDFIAGERNCTDIVGTARMFPHDPIPDPFTNT